MFAYRRMALKPLIYKLLIWTSLSFSPALSSSIVLTDELKSLTPACAHSCIKDFIAANYPRSVCGSGPSLQCLCTNLSEGGFTLGEGAALCLGGARASRICDSGDVTDVRIENAHDICIRVPNAFSNTHDQLSVTVVVPSSGTGSIVMPTPDVTSKTSTTRPGPTTSSDMITSTSSKQATGSRSTIPVVITTSKPTASSDSSTTTSAPSTTLSSSLTTSSTTTATASTIPEPTETSGAEDEASSPVLGTGQIVGISIGAVGGAILLGLAAVFLARRSRRRNFPDDDESFIGDVKKDRDSPPQSRASRIFHISPPVFRISRPLGAGPVPRQDRDRDEGYGQPLPPPPSMYSSGEERGTIGLAISRPRSEVTPRASRTSETQAQAQGARLERKPSRLLPAKPALTLTIPPAQRRGEGAGKNATIANRNGGGDENGPPSQQSQSQSLQPPPLTTTDRASTMTNMTAFADLDSEAAEGQQIWRPPPTDPQSATTYYVADRWGNWVLSGEHRRSDVERAVAAAELDTYTPLTKSPIERQEEEAAAMARAISASNNYVGYRNGSASGNNYSATGGDGDGYPKSQPAFLLVDPNDPSMASMSMSRSSSLYSQASAVRPSRPSGSLPPARRRSSGSSRKGKGGSGAYYRATSGGGGGIKRSDSKDSQASVTTINTSSSGPFDDETIIEDNDNDNDDDNENNGMNVSDVARLSQLSPVAESPSPISMGGSGNGVGGAGRNGGVDGGTYGTGGAFGAFGTRYPKIPGRLDGATIRLVPPPKRPNFSSSPPGQPSPTLGAVTPIVTGSPSAYPSPLRPKRPYNRGPTPAMPAYQPAVPMSAQSSGSGFSPVPAPASAFSQQQKQQQRTSRELQSQQQQQQTPQVLPRTPSPQIRRLTPPLTQNRHSQQQYQHSQQRQIQPQRSNPYPTPPSAGPPRLDTSSPTTATGRQGPHVASQLTASTASPMSTATSTSAASSLLAKRVGSDKAAALALDRAGKQRAAPWRRQGGEGDGGGLLSPDMAGLASPRNGPMTSGTLPMTPTWQPKLTPTRRGDDLFLSVQ